MKDPHKEDSKAKTLRVHEWMKIFNNASDSYQATHPHWYLEVLVSLIKWGLRNLKDLIENEKSKEITWDDPFVELHYPVEWDWKSPRDGYIIHGQQILGKLTKKNTSDIKTATKTFAKMMAARFNVMALSQFTNGAWFEKRANAYIQYLPVELDAMVRRIKGQRKKDEVVEEFFRPFSIGVARVAIPSGLKENARIPKKFAQQLKIANQQIDIPGVSFSGETGGRKMWAGLIFEIQPLIIDYDGRKAYHPITVGLAFERKLVGNDVISMTPREWPRKDRNTFWDEIIQGIDKLAERLIPKNERQGSVIIETNDGLKIVRSLSNTKELNSAINWATRLGCKSELQSRHAEQQRLLQELDAARTASEKGKALEKLVSCLFASVEGFTVTGERIQTETEEIDLEILNASEDPLMRREEGIILVECKNWTSKCGKNEFVVFRTKMENRTNRCSLGFLISWNGFADTITKEMLRGSRERLLIVPLDGKQIQDAVRDGSFFNLIMSAWNKATLV